jgi:hypothetical protein
MGELWISSSRNIVCHNRLRRRILPLRRDIQWSEASKLSLKPRGTVTRGLYGSTVERSDVRCTRCCVQFRRESMKVTFSRIVVSFVATVALMAAGVALAGRKGDTGYSSGSGSGQDEDTACEEAKFFANEARPAGSKVKRMFDCVCREDRGGGWHCTANARWEMYIDME